MKQAVLLVNLGSPDSFEVKDVRRYLREFLMDGRVIDVPYIFRKMLIEGIVLPTRPKKSAEAYASIWWEEGSPLIVLSQRLLQAVQAKTEMPVALGMRYGNPSIASGLAQLSSDHPDLEEVLLVPLYPHYAMSSYETVVVKTEEIVQEKYPHLKLHSFPPFYRHPAYISTLADQIASHLDPEYEHLLFSYHGIPERHVRKSDPSHAHCLSSANCCELENVAHHSCYRHQVKKTTALVAKKLGLKEGTYSVAFQSRLGRDPWLQPYTDKTIHDMPARGVKRLSVVCPAFVSDCLETIEEIGMEAREDFLEAGGSSFQLIPCLNDDERWVDTLAGWFHDFFSVYSLSYEQQ